MAYGKARTVRRGRRGGGVLLLVVLLPIAALMLPSTVLVLAGLIPTFVAYAVDRDSEKSLPLTVGAMNICGIMPFCIRLWQNGHQMDLSLSMLAQPVTWVVMYSAAGIGWVLYFAIPPLVAGAMVARDEEKIRRLEEQREALVEEWGPGVTGLAAADPETGATQAAADGEAAVRQEPDAAA